MSIGLGMTGFENTGVNTPAHMLNEGTKNAPVERRESEISIENYTGRAHERRCKRLSIRPGYDLGERPNQTINQGSAWQPLSGETRKK
jgi:hypothetical protein